MDLDELNKELDLDPLDKVAIIAIAAFIVAFTFIVTTCFVVPGCCGYNCLKRRRKKSFSDQIIMLDFPKNKISIKLNEKITPLYQSVGSQLQIVEAQECISPGVPDLFNAKLQPTTFLPYNMIKPQAAVKIQLKYSPEQDVTALGRLSIEIIDAVSIPSRCYPTLPDTRIRLQVTHKRWTLSRQEKVIHDVQTRTVRAANSPVFEQTFTFAAALSDLKAWCLSVTIFDEDRLTRCRETCTCKINVRDIKGLTEGTVCPVTIPFEPVIVERGQLLVALNYLPTSQRLSVCVTKSLKLSWQEVAPELNLFRPSLRVTLLDHGGRVLKKRKISGKNGVEAPTFNGSACFHISPMVYETATVIIQVCSGKDGERPEDEDKKKANVLGYVALGWLVPDESGRNHWRAVLQSPRKTLSLWHPLR